MGNMKTTTVRSLAEASAELESFDRETLTIAKSPVYAGQTADLEARRPKRVLLAEQVVVAQRNEFESQFAKLEKARESALPDFLRAQEALAPLRQEYESAAKRLQVGLDEKERLGERIREIETSIDQIRARQNRPIENLDETDLEIRELARAAIASQDRDGNRRVYIGSFTITGYDIAAAESLERIYKSNPDKRAAIARALQSA
jgi:hypothetical protein